MVVPKRALMIGGGVIAVVVLYSSTQSPPGSSAEQKPTDTTCRVEVTADVLNVRSAPEAAAEVVGKFKKGAESDASKDVQNGYRRLSDGRWASSEFLKPLDGRDCG